MNFGPFLPTTPADALTDIERIQLAADDNVPDQHVVSKVLLRRFAAEGGPRKGLLFPFNLDHPAGRHQPKGPDGCGKIKNFVPVASRSLEQLWKPTEDALHDALRSVDDETIFEKPAHVATIKDAIALHYVRSPQIRDLHRGIWPRVRAGNRALLLNEDRQLLQRLYYKKTGLYAGGMQVLEDLVDELMQPWTEAADSSVLFRSRLDPIFAQARDMIAGWSLEILKAPARGEFLIGDIPALTMRHDRVCVGVRSGIALGDANSVVLPLAHAMWPRSAPQTSSPPLPRTKPTTSTPCRSERLTATSTSARAVAWRST